MASHTDRKTALRHQIEFILDNASGRTHEVILKTAQPGNQDETFARTMSNAMRKRSMAMSPRDVLPAEYKLLQSGRRDENTKPTRSAERALGVRNLSLSAQVARSRIFSQEIAQVRSANTQYIRSMSRNETIGLNILKERETSAKKKRPFEPRIFWTSGSILLNMTDNELMKLRDEETVGNLEGVYPNRRVTLPPLVTPKFVPQSVEDNKVSAWGIRASGALSAWGAFNARGKNVKIGLLDTGVDANHPDLKDKITDWAEFDEKGDHKTNSRPHDSDQHGTHCAGTIIGGNHSGVWIGMAPEATIAAALVLNGARGGTDAQVLAGIDWAVEQEVDVINMSLGGLMWGPDVPSTYTSAIINALRVGIPVVTAIGNDGSQTSGSPGNDFLAFAVGAIDPINRAAGFTGGRTQVIKQSPFFPQDMLPLVYSKPDVSAPGVAIYSSIPPKNKQMYDRFNGTSMAAPHVAGAIALLLSATEIKYKVPRSERAFVIQDLLTGSAEELGEAGQDHRFGFGRIDILRAIGLAKSLGY